MLVEPKEIHKEVANKLNVQEELVDELNRLQYDFLEHDMKEYEHVKLNVLGKWLFRPKANSKLRPLYEQKML